MAEQVTRQATVFKNVVADPNQANCTRVDFAEFVCGLIFVPPGVATTLSFLVTTEQPGLAANGPPWAPTGDREDFYPLFDATGKAVSVAVNTGGVGDALQLPAALAGALGFKIQSSVTVNLTLTLKS